MRKRQYLLFILAVALLIAGSTWFLYFRTEARQALSIVFIEQEQFKAGEEIDPLSLIASASSANILYPEIDTEKPGEKDLLYIIIGEDGRQKEFLKTIYVKAIEPPALELQSDSVTIMQGEPFAAQEQVKRCEDLFDGKLDVKITGDYDLQTPGRYELNYHAVNSSQLETNKKLLLIVQAKERPPEEKEKNPEDVKTPAKKEPIEHSSDFSPEAPPAVQSPASPSRSVWLFIDGYNFQSAQQACMKEGQSVNGRYDCTVIEEDGIAKGYRLVIK